MGKTLQIPAQLTPYQVIENSDVGTLTNNTSTIDAANITVTQVKNALGETTFNVGTLCTSANINGWANFSPMQLSYNGTTKEFTHVADTAPYSLGDFAGYNHTARNPRGTTSDTEFFVSTLSGTVTISGAVNVGEYDWGRKQVGNITMDHIWIIVEKDGVVTKNKKAIANHNSGSVSIQVDVNYTITARGSDTFTAAMWFGNTYQEYVKVPENYTFNTTIKDSSVYIQNVSFQKSSASGAGFNSTYNYSLELQNDSVSGKNVTADLRIIQISSPPVYSNSFRNKLYATYTDSSNTTRTEIIAQGITFGGGGYTTVTGVLTYTPALASRIDLELRDAILDT